MSVSRGDSGTGEVTEPGKDSEANGVTASAMRRALARARDGKPLDVDEATVLLHARGEDLQTLLAYASRTRDAGLQAANRPGVITYSRKVFIPLTRLCRDRCGYCTFATVPRRPQQHPVHHGHPHRHRRDPGRTRRIRLRHPEGRP